MKAIVIVTAGGFLVQILASLAVGPGANGWLVTWLGLRTWSSAGGGEVALNLLFPLQLFTYGLLHGDFWHLFWNMLFLFIYGQFIEPTLGKRQFLRLYVGGAVFGGLVQWAVGLSTASAAPTVGASAAVYAVMVLTAFRYPHQRLFLFPLPIAVPIWLLVGAKVFFDLNSFVAGSGGHVAVAAHLGGAIFGWIWHRRGDVVGRAVEKHRREKTRRELEARAGDRREMDRILAKIQSTGLSSLTSEERAFLDRRSRELRQDTPR